MPPPLPVLEAIPSHRAAPRRREFLAVLVLSLVSCGPWTSNRIYGIVTDSRSAGVPNATVTLLRQDTNISIGLKTDRSGEFESPRLPEGKYIIVVEKDGFEPDRRIAAVSTAGDAIRTDLHLKARLLR